MEGVGHKSRSVLSLVRMCFWDDFIVSRVRSAAVNGELGAIESRSLLHAPLDVTGGRISPRCERRCRSQRGWDTPPPAAHSWTRRWRRSTSELFRLLENRLFIRFEADHWVSHPSAGQHSWTPADSFPSCQKASKKTSSGRRGVLRQTAKSCSHKTRGIERKTARE